MSSDTSPPGEPPDGSCVREKAAEFFGDVMRSVVLSPTHRPLTRFFHKLVGLRQRGALVAQACSLPYRRFVIGGVSAIPGRSEQPTTCRLQSCDTAERGRAATKIHRGDGTSAEWGLFPRTSAPVPSLRCPSFLQNSRRARRFWRILVDCKSALRFVKSSA